MLRSYLAAALRNLARNRLYAAISIVGLAVGMAAAILTGLYIRDELTFDHFIPGHEKVHIVISEVTIPGRAHIVQQLAPFAARSWIKQDFPAADVARLMFGLANARHGAVEAVEPVAWVDPEFFRLLPMPAVAGDPGAALAQAGTVVLTRAMARKYFGRDAPIGEVLELRRSIPLRVTAVIADPPRNSSFEFRIYASGLTAGSPQRAVDVQLYRRGDFYVAGRTYVRFEDPGKAREAAADMTGLVRRHMTFDGRWDYGLAGGLKLAPLDKLHLYPLKGVLASVTPQGNPAVLWSLAFVASLILLMAGVNFVNLSTARAARRGVEVGVRKVAGARRRELVTQFLGEALAYALIGMVCACALVELVLPVVNAQLQRDMHFELWLDPALLGALAAATLGLGLLAGLYPAFVLSSFRPVAVLKGGRARPAGSGLIRTGLVTLQFAALTGLILSTAVILQQTRFALRGTLTTAADRVVVINLAPLQSPGGEPKPMCRDALVDEVRRLPGVARAACSSTLALDQGDATTSFILPNGQRPLIGFAPVDAGFFELYGVAPVAGRTLTDASADEPRDVEGGAATIPKTVVVNETAARLIGFNETAKAVGSTLRFANDLTNGPPPVVVGVVPDFSFDLIHGAARPMIYFIAPPQLSQLNIRLNGRDVPGTLAALDNLWRRLGEPRAVQRRFLSEQLAGLYAEVVRQGAFITGLAVVAIFIACLGLLGLAAFTAERRTKEIGVRKALGASTVQILELLLRQFTKPVLLANLIAWPAAWWAMDRWLHGFSRRIALEPWLFLAASALALLIAWSTVLAHALKVARAKAIDALRYE